MGGERYKPQNLHDSLVRLMEECAEVIKDCSKGLRFGTRDFDPNDATFELNIERIKREIEDVNEAFESVRKYDISENHSEYHNISVVVKGKDFTRDKFMLGLKDFLKGKYVSEPRLQDIFRSMGITVGKDCIEWLMK